MNEELKRLADDLKYRWINRFSPPKGEPSRFSKAISCFLRSLDELMVLANQFKEAGTDKKIAVMAVIAGLYDSIVGPLLPLWLKPFSSGIRVFVLNVVVSQLIDFLVAKVKSVQAVT